jgi:hypothetical protein
MARRRSLVSGAIATVAIIVGSTLGTGGCAVDAVDEDDEGNLVGYSDEDMDPADYMDDEGPESSSVSSELAGCKQCTNCVLYARCRQRRLPYGLTSWSSKLRIINSQSPRAGCVAVIHTGSQYGHVAYVTGVSGSRVHIDEGNWGRRCNRRSGTKAQLRIRGFWCPR